MTKQRNSKHRDTIRTKSPTVCPHWLQAKDADGWTVRHALDVAEATLDRYTFDTSDTLW